MTQTVRRQDAIDIPAPDAQPPVVASLRMAALACRAGPRASPSACSLLEPGAGPEDFAMALARALPELLLRRPVLWRPGARGRSFDEDWLVAICAAQARGDAASIRFLSRRRVRPGMAPYLLLLLRGLQERVDFAVA